MTTISSLCLTLALFLLVALSLPAGAQTTDTRCVGDGGIALCSAPTHAPDSPNAPMDADMWTYNVCDQAGVFLWREAAWTKAKNGKPIFDADIVPVSTAFEQFLNNACQVTATDSGWGYTIPQNILCWSGGTLTQNQVSIRDFRRLDMGGFKPSASGCNLPLADTIYAGRWRKVACPKTYNIRTKANGDLECWKMPPECTQRGKVGNPITLLDGCKAQRELDYRSRTTGGVEVERFYNSGGYFRFDVAPERASDVWRTTWDRRVIVPPTSGTLLAYAQRADGSLQAFAPSGREMHNNQGGASSLLQRLTDPAGAPSGWRLTTADMDIETYDAAGRLLTVVLRNGRRYTLTYADGRLATVTDTFGGLVTFTYDASGRLGGFVAPGNRRYVYGYDAMGRLTSVTYPDNAVRTYHYEDPNFVHALTGITDENGARYATWGYESRGRATLSQHAGGVDSVTLYYGSPSTGTSGQVAVDDGYGTTRTYYYQTAGGVVRIRMITDPAGTTTSTFDANGNVATLRDANGTQTNYTYDLARNLEISRTEAFGTALARTITTEWHPVYRLPAKISAPSGTPGVLEVTDYAYDAQGNLLQKTVTAGAKSRQWTMTYSALGQLLTVDGPRIDQADVVTNTYYDINDPCVGCRGNVKTTINAMGHVTVFDAYDVDGQPTRITDPNGVATAMTYDARGRLKTRTVNAGGALTETTAFDYDSAGQLVAATMPDGSSLRYQHDAAHRLTEITDSLGNVIQYTLDAMGNRIKEDTFDPSDDLRRTQRRIYDALSRRYNDIDASGQKTVYSYDANGNVKSTMDPLNHNTVQSYDALNRLTSSTDPAAGTTRYGYDAKDRLTTVQDPINLTTTYTYDGLGNLTQLTSPDTGIATYVPDAAGNTIGTTDARGLATTYVYDALNRQTLATFSGGSVALEYDNTANGGAFAKGRLTKVADPSGTTTYQYDAWGRVVVKVQTVGVGATAKTLTIGYQYTAGRMSGITYPSGRNLSYAFDAQGHVTGISIGGQLILSGAAYAPFGPVQGWTWANGQIYQRAYDLDGRVATVTTGPDSTAFGSGNWMFGYDSLNRLSIAALPPGDAFAYAYDGNGNRKQETRAGATTNYTYFAASNRLQASTGALARSFTYDAAGNISTTGGLSFTFDGRGRLTQVSNGYRYAINGVGQRVSKIGPGGTTHFAYDELGHLIGEYDTSGAVRQEVVYLTDTPVASVRTSASGGVDIYPIYSDHLNTPRLITDPTNRTVWEWPLDTFGAGSANENPSGLGTFSFNLRFPGQYYDAETGLHYNYFRDYDPKVGRYVESDPIGLRGGINGFVYVSNRPAVVSDPFGLFGLPWQMSPGFVPVPPPRSVKHPGFVWPWPGWPGNGNVYPGFEPQDGICTVPNWLGGDRMNNNPCIKGCCKRHDKCYENFNCNMSSWGGGPISVCGLCNMIAEGCITYAAVTTCVDCGG